MSLPVISVVIPTIPGRDATQTIADYERYSGEHADVQIVLEEGHPSCGAAWQAGSNRAVGDYIHLTADDIEPLPGWDAAAMAANDRGWMPGARVWRPRGDLESAVEWQRNGKHGDRCDLARVPFCSTAQWRRFIGPMIPIQYYSDNWFHWKGELGGMVCRLADGYEFVHHRPAGARPGEMDQQYRDRKVFERCQREWLER